jgi:hypothetical protein
MNTDRRPRAQGRANIAWPEGTTRFGDDCVVALEVILASTKPGGTIEPDARHPWAGWGVPEPTLHALIAKAFVGSGRKVLQFEVSEIGWIDPHCPLRLERRTTFPNRKRVFVEALVLPCDDRQAAELSAILRTDGGSRQRHARALSYARELEARWAARCPAQTLPLINLRKDFTIRRAAEAPVAQPEPAPTEQTPRQPTAVS